MNASAMGAAALALAVMLGAFGAHGLRDRLDAYSMGIWEKAVFYHFVHALGLLIVPMMSKAGLAGQAAAAWVSVLLVAGILIFSGSLYLMAVTGVRWLGAITPIGGVSFIAAWVLLAIAVLRNTGAK